MSLDVKMRRDSLFQKIDRRELSPQMQTQTTRSGSALTENEQRVCQQFSAEMRPQRGRKQAGWNRQEQVAVLERCRQKTGKMTRTQVRRLERETQEGGERETLGYGGGGWTLMYGGKFCDLFWRGGGQRSCWRLEVMWWRRRVGDDASSRVLDLEEFIEVTEEEKAAII